MSRKHRYPVNSIRRDYTYTVAEVADLYGITSDTVFRWIRNEGLQRVPHSRKYFVHSSELVAFLTTRNRRNKKPSRTNAIFCCKCRRPREPELVSLSFQVLPNKTVRIRGLCSECGTRVNKVVSSKIWSATHPFHPDHNASTKEHSGGSLSPRECHT
ncbi:MAG: hypothetical protein CMM59_01215 [Rhodospirillaceae bacterium]|nr:hypothetical protein [Rhodospirillaceae bacterium]